MKAITKYKANDGSEWNSEADALKRESDLEKIDAAMAPLGKKPDDPGCAFANGDGYIQHSAEAYETVRRALIGLFMEGNPNAFPKDPDPYIIHLSWFCRYSDDGGMPLYGAFSRLYCIDAEHREWGQPYYALNPGQGTQRMREDRR